MTTLDKIKEAQSLWAIGIVEIGSSSDARARTNKMLDDLYNFNEKTDPSINQILFKPTLASVDPIRTTRAETLSYFIGGPLDQTGFALKPWNHVIFNEDQQVIKNPDILLVMGTYVFYPSSGDPVSVDYTFGYRNGIDDDEKLRIVLHHSSLSV